MPANPPLDSIVAELASLEALGLGRHLREVRGPQAPEMRVDGRLAVNFCSNNYLGLANHPQLIAAATAALGREGYGAGAARLITGNFASHRALEADIAAWKGTEAALLFNSGYHANLGILAGLAGPGDAIYSDQLNHASIIDGARLSRAAVHVFPHNNLEVLDASLATTPPARRRLIITESLFSMDGDRAPLGDLAGLARRHQALLIVDDAHAAGVLGEGGAGLARIPGVHLQMGTFGKALGGFGAYAAGPRPLIDLLINRARSFVFTTALPAPVVAAAQAAISLLATAEIGARRARLASHTVRLHEGLVGRGLLSAARVPSHIVPLIVGDARGAMALSEELLARGLFVQGIRPPTVPEGSARLRITLMATHLDEHIDALLGTLGKLRGAFRGLP